MIEIEIKKNKGIYLIKTITYTKLNTIKKKGVVLIIKSILKYFSLINFYSIIQFERQRVFYEVKKFKVLLV